MGRQPQRTAAEGHILGLNAPRPCAKRRVKPKACPIGGIQSLDWRRTHAFAAHTLKVTLIMRQWNERWRALGAASAVALALAIQSPAGQAQAAEANAEPILEAREAYGRKDRARLASLRKSTLALAHPLAPWVDYWELNNRLFEVSQSEVDAFYARWPASYVEDRLRNDWLLELGRRRDWAQVRQEFPRFRMNDDRQVTCYALLARHQEGQNISSEARVAWLAQREADDGCQQLARTLFAAGPFTEHDLWQKAREAAEQNKARAARQAVEIMDEDLAPAVQEAFEKPERYLNRRARTNTRAQAEITSLALARWAASAADDAAAALHKTWEARLPADLAAWAWAQTARHSAFRLQADAADQFERSDTLAARTNPKAAVRATDWSDETLAWKARAALRADAGAGRWRLLLDAINAMTPNAQREPVWVYWKARALQARAEPGQSRLITRASTAGGSANAATAGVNWSPAARALLESMASPLNFYGILALEDLGRPVVFPDRPNALAANEREAAANHPALQRALALIDMGLRPEGTREWNFTVRFMGDRELLAAAQLACDRQVWDRCINTSERTRSEVDLSQRFPTPFRQELLSKTADAGLDPAYVYGLIRQESRFITDARSHVGASGLMQVMPATAQWTAKKIGLPYSSHMITDRDINLKIGTSYLKLVLDSFDGMKPLATAAYNAGPSRPRRWREGPILDAAAWVENIPFSETRDYVKKVLANAVGYAAVLGHPPGNGSTAWVGPSVRARLGRFIGPRDSAQTAQPGDENLP
jgi:soluble lytic murein transglycosylase